MKKLFLTFACACFLASCSGGGTSIPATTKEIIKTPTTITETTFPAITTKEDTPTTAPTVKPTPSPITPSTTPPTKTYTSSEVIQHNTASDCWLILSGGVYDVTSYIPRHPGGAQIVRGCGKDATQMFAQHPASAKALKEQFKIGILAQ
ncbi:MAG: cytochrome b5-like heme/steroid binding domain-containing protein [Candidatus Gracilibacteria bacterium]